MEPLSGPLDDARIVGLGEATHGAREFFSLKDRIFRFLVQKKGFTVFAIEAPWLTSLAIDRYITNGKGDPREALAGTFAVWDNQEVLDLIKWMRAYNVTRGTRPALRFVGIDIQDDPVAVQNAILDFIKLARPADLEIAAQRLACLTAQQTSSAACVADIAGVKSIVDSLAATTSLPRQQVLDAQHTADIAVEIVEQRSDLDMMDKSNARDRFMAENVKWFSRTMFPGARIAVWAHDGHVMTSNSYGMIPMGTYLRSWYGAAYYVVGFAFYSGSTSPNGVSPPIMLSGGASAGRRRRLPSCRHAALGTQSAINIAAN